MSVPVAATDESLDALFRALASGPRRQIVAHLTEGPTTTPALGERFSFTKQALNRHVLALEDVGLIARRRDGRVDRVALVPESLREVTNWADAIHAAWEGNLDRLGDLLAALDDSESDNDRGER